MAISISYCNTWVVDGIPKAYAFSKDDPQKPGCDVNSVRITDKQDEKYSNIDVYLYIVGLGIWKWVHNQWPRCIDIQTPGGHLQSFVRVHEKDPGAKWAIPFIRESALGAVFDAEHGLGQGETDEP